MFVLKALLLTAAVLACSAQAPPTTPVPILKQINKQNDDGSYSYGYEAADGSFKIETKYPNGDVAGKYGYVDENGKSREISYGASSQRGFEPQGSGINVPPPTLHDPTSSNALTDGQEDDGQYREDPKIYEDPKYNSRAQGRQPASTFKQFHQPAQPTPAPEPQYQRYTQPAPRFQSQFESGQQYQPNQAVQQSQFRSGPLFTQQTSLLSQSPQQFTQENRPQSQVFHTQPQFSYQAFQPQPQYQAQSQPQYQAQSQPQYQAQPQPQYQAQPQYQPQNYQNQNYNPFVGHPAQNFDPNTGSYSINFTG